NMTAFPLMATKLKEYLGDRCSIDSVAIASPDQGGIERAREFGKCLFNTDEFDLTVVEKHRDQEHKHMSEALGLYGNVKGKTVILVDDMITSGGTLMHAAELALERGAKAVIAAIVHHDFSATAPKKLQDSKLEAIISTNSIALKPEQNIEKLKEVSISPIIAAEIATTFQK
ncbi:ribose-phosphate pyrophosphokinase, partial [Candidatus Roizmanbacteria bacterium]|nr:ribose-phosphate pyrophosphokinase [Candidatus Roizmanbacteria bacterium]